MFRGAVLLWAVLHLSACRGSDNGEGPARRNVTITTRSGVTLAATLYTGAPGAPGLVLVHGLGSTRKAWENFAAKAQSAGYAVVAFDIRGHGNSTSKDGSEISYRAFKTEDWLGALNDIDAIKTLLVHEGADPENTVVIGADIGANLSLHYALQHPDLPAIVMISPGLEYKGIATREQIAQFGERPVLLMTSTGDSYSASSCTTLKSLALGHCELREYAGTAHGTDLLDASPSAIGQIFVWLQPIIGPGE